jgi:predicted Zn-dependent protease
MRRATKRRLLILLSVALLASLGVTGVMKYRARKLHYQCVKWKNDGLAEKNAGNYAKAIEDLRQYRRYFPDDLAALQAFIEARSRVPAPGHQEIPETAAALEHFLAIDPTRTDLRHQLTSLYVLMGHDTEAMDSATRLLDQSQGDDVAALRVLALTNARLRRWDKSLAALDQLLKLAPTDLPNQIQRFMTMKEAGKPRDEIVRLAEQLLNAPENRLKDGSPDPRFELLKAVSLEITELASDTAAIDPNGKADKRTAPQLLRDAALRTPPDTQFSAILIERLKHFGLYDEALIALRRVVDAGGQPDAELALARRLFESSQWSELITRTEQLHPQTPESESELLAIRALALTATGKSSEAGAIQQKLALRTTESSALAWALIVQGAREPKTQDFKTLQTSLLKVENQSAYLEFYLGDTYSRLGESEMAVKLWDKAAADARTWSLPVECLANALLERGRFDAALAAARAAAFRSRDTHGNVTGSAAMTLIRAETARLDQTGDATTGNAITERRLLEQVDSVQKQNPGEPFTLPVQVALLGKLSKSETTAASKASRERAITIVQNVLIETGRPTEDVLLRLAVVNRMYNLGLEDECLNRSEKLYGLTPNLAMVRTSSLLAHAKRDDAMKLIRSAAHERKIGEPRAWDLALAKMLEAARDPEAPDAWKRLASSYPDSLAIQEAVINAASVQDNRDLVEQSIDRLQKLTGADGLMWRVAKARWILAGTTPPRIQLETAATLLNEVLKVSPDYSDAHYLLARCLESLGDAEGAIDHMTRAAGSPNSTVDLIRLLQSTGKSEKANQLLDQLSERSQLDPSLRRQVAMLLMQSGKARQAMELLAAGPNAGSEDLLTASLFDQQGNYARAKTICEALLKNPDPQTIGFAADLYASHAESALAAQTLSLLDNMRLFRGERELILAQHAARFGSPAETLAAFRAAAAAAPANALTWHSYVGWLLQRGMVNDAIAAADDGLKPLPNDLHLQAVVHEGNSLKAAASVPAFRPLLASLVDSNLPLATVTQALHAALALDTSAPATDSRPLKQLADQFPRLLSLQIYCIDALIQAGYYSDAISIAQRLGETFPSHPDGPRIAAQLLRATNQWTDCIAMAELWRERSVREKLAADVLIAAARIEMRQYSEAKKQLDGDVAGMQKSADSPIQKDAIATYATSLVLLGDSAGAYVLLDPILRADHKSRLRWASTAVQRFDEMAAKQAIEHVSSFAPPSDESEQIAVAESLANLSQRFGDKYLDAAIDRISPFMKQASPSTAILTAIGSLEEQRKHFDAADALFRKALQQDANAPITHNNLAMSLLRDPENHAALQEALLHARAAVKMLPLAQTYDTLARAYALNHDAENTVLAMKLSVRLEPGNISRRLDFVGLLLDLNERTEARAAADAIDIAMTSATDEGLRRRAALLRQRLDAPATASPAASR